MGNRDRVARKTFNFNSLNFLSGHLFFPIGGGGHFIYSCRFGLVAILYEIFPTGSDKVFVFPPRVHNFDTLNWLVNMDSE